MLLVFPCASQRHRSNGGQLQPFEHFRIGYGYEGVPDPGSDEGWSGTDPRVYASKTDGIFRVDLVTGAENPLVSLWDLVDKLTAVGAPDPATNPTDVFAWVNNLSFNFDGSRLSFFIRFNEWDSSKKTHMLTLNRPASGDWKDATIADVTLLDKSGKGSHFVWTDNDTFLCWSEISGTSAIYEYDVTVGDLPTPTLFDTGFNEHPWQNSHINFVQSWSNKWLVGDTGGIGPKMRMAILT